MGCSDWSTATFTTLSPPAPTVVLSGTTVIVNGVKRPKLNWTVPPGMGSPYYVYRYFCPPSGGDCLGTGELIANDVTTTTYTDLTVVVIGKFDPIISTVWYFVKADGGASAPSNHIHYNSNYAAKQGRPNPGEESQPLPIETKLMESFPNPFNPTTTITYQLAAPGYVRLSIFNILGEEIARLTDGDHPAGYYTAEWDAGAAPSGIYYARMTIMDPLRQELYQSTRKLLLMR